MRKKKESIGVYIHIPFCKKKCGYCDFLSFSDKESEINNYFKYLKKEIELYEKREYDTIYFGGGTPSLASVEDIKLILDSLEKDKKAEITIEVNPGTVTLEKLKRYREIGINRISIGSQSFNNDRLKILGRIHDSNQIEECFKNAREAGFDNISLDLMFALPGQSKEELKEDIQKITEFKPEHISVYSLIWEEGTAFEKMLSEGKIFQKSEEEEAEMYEFVIKFLKESGYIHYEISNFAQKGFEAKHNLKYWENREYLGIGLGASGYIDTIRYKNFTKFKEYYKAIDLGKKPILEFEKIDGKSKIMYKCILGLRLLTTGVEIEKKIYLETINKLVERGLIVKKENGKYILSSRGLFIANSVFEEFLI